MSNHKHITFFRYLQVNKNLLIFLFFLAVSSVSWLLTQLNQNFTTDIECRLDFTDLPGNKALAVETSPHITLNVTGHGYTLLWYKLNPLIRMPFSLQMIGIQSGMNGGSYRYWLLSRQIKERLQPDFGPDILINSSTPDTLFIELCEKVSRKLPVRPGLDLRFARQYMLCGPMECLPDSVVASGPRTMVDTMQAVYTSYFRTRPLDDTLEMDIPLSHPGNISLSQNFVRVVVCAEKFTEAELIVPVSPLNLPEGIHLKTFPAEVKMTYRVGLSHFKEMQADLFTFTVDYRDALKDGHSRIPVSLSRHPQWVDGIKFLPKEVDFILEK